MLEMVSETRREGYALETGASTHLHAQRASIVACHSSVVRRSLSSVIVVICRHPSSAVVVSLAVVIVCCLFLLSMRIADIEHRVAVIETAASLYRLNPCITAHRGQRVRFWRGVQIWTPHPFSAMLDFLTGYRRGMTGTRKGTFV